MPPPATSRSEEAEHLLRVLDAVVQTLGSALPSSVEIVLHDLDRLPNSIVSVSGDVTRRSIGDPATDVLLQAIVSGQADSMVGYQTRLPDGRELRSSTQIVRDSQGHQVAAVCVNADVTAWLQMRDLVTRVLQPLSAVGSAPAAPVAAVPNELSEHRGEAPSAAGERFPKDVDELAAHLLSDAVGAVGIPVDLMKKEHKLAVVSRLRQRGMFLLRDAVEMVAAHLHVTRFTIYNYLNEIERQSGVEVANIYRDDEG
ncbi:helix-turn-helix transcriptional regulator [Microbacterium sp. P26]|nr:helix-turn-helix transcriptional regulator [Microbacterium sp. P26]